ncbi:MAG TPA: DUF4397 domain-containing protein [Gemmatimonadaceae bacterium]|nr:DUF4397 domain-containing protein [Gemmatimonadaceae bacterium]
MRFSRKLLAVLSAVAVAACSDTNKKGIVAVNPPLAFVRYFNAVGDTLPFDFRPIDQIEFSTPFLAVPYRAIGLGNFQGYEAKSRHIRVFPNSLDLATTSSVIFDTTMTLTAGSYYTFLHTGYTRTGASPRVSMTVMTDVFPTPGANIALRAINVGPDLGAVDIYVTATATDPLPAAPTFAGVAFKSATPYITLPPGPAVLRVFAAGTTSPAIATVTAAPGTAGTPTSNPIAGANVAGSVLTAMVYSKAVPGSKAEITAGSGVNTAPSLVVWIDRSPPNTAP